MNYNVKLKIEGLNKSKYEFTFTADRLKAIGGLPSGKVAGFVLNTEQESRKIAIRPYYRRFNARDLHIFAIQIPEAKS